MHFIHLRRRALPVAMSCAISTAALILFTNDVFAQDAPNPSGIPNAAAAPNVSAEGGPSDGATLPEVQVIQKSLQTDNAVEPKPEKPPTPSAASDESSKPISKAKRKVAKAKPVPAVANTDSVGADISQEALSEQANTLANPGTPSANVAPVAGLAGSPGAQTASGIDTKQLENDQVFSVSDVLKQSPGVSLKQGNGPRDMGISIRGSNARNGFAVRNIVVMEDGFPVTQPDGLSRTDLTDPHAYGGIDVWRGPSSALFGNYATGGAINFRTRPGGEINGFEYGSEFGSFNYYNNYIIAGGKSGGVEASLFASDVRGDGYFEYGAFDTQTVNALMKLNVTGDDTVTLKFINNNLNTELPFRYSLNQFLLNPYQRNCHTAATAAPGCQTQNFSATGQSPFVPQTAEQAGALRDDRRTIGGIRWEHRVDEDTQWRIQYVADDRNIRQPTGTTSAEGDYFSHNVMGDFSQRQTIAGLPATFMIGGFWNYLPIDGYTFFVAPGGDAPNGELQQNTEGSTTNYGARAREEVYLTDALIAVAGIGVEKTDLVGTNTSFRYNSAGAVTSMSTVDADRRFVNVAPEVGLLYRPDRAWQFRGRIGTGYGTPQISNLFVQPDGSAGNNTTLESQRNVGYDLGADWTPVAGLSLSVTGFYEFFTNELVSQSPGPGLPSYTFNAPASEHRGIEAAIDWQPFGGWRLSTVYTYNDQYYTDYAERLSRTGPSISETFDRSGNKIPGVAPNELTARVGYDEESGVLKGLGAFVEYQWRDAFYMENANLLKAPDAQVVNLNIHYNHDYSGGYVKSLAAYFEVRNVFDETYISAANNISDSLSSSGIQNGASVLANTSGTIYAGPPRTFYGGVKLKF